MKTLAIHLRKVLIVGVSTTTVMAAAAPARADVFVLDYWAADGSFQIELFNGTAPPRPPAGGTLISVVDVTTHPVLSGAPVGAPGPVPGAGLLSLTFFILAGLKTKMREIAAFARQTRPWSRPAWSSASVRSALPGSAQASVSS
jgi:hypothetical protein